MPLRDSNRGQENPRRDDAYENCSWRKLRDSFPREEKHTRFHPAGKITEISIFPEFPGQSLTATHRVRFDDNSKTRGKFTAD
jgi:hypothetical protein